MKETLISLFLALNLLASGSTYYVATTGSDSNNGKIEFPFRTLNKAWSLVMAGDTIFIRGGIYNNTILPPTTFFRNKNGTKANPIIILNYPGEKPVLDYSDASYTTQKFGIRIDNVDYLHLKGIRITNINQPIDGTIAQYGLILWNDVNNCIFELIETDHIGGWGITIGDNSHNNLFLNCDSHHNADPYSAIPYDWSDGFQSSSKTSDNNTFRGCRAWSNSDDGWDLRLYEGSAFLESCWSFRNGYIPGTWINAGNGEGFKLGIKRLPSVTAVLRTVSNCLAFDNYSVGFHSSILPEYGTFQSVLFNNTAFRNGIQCNDAGFGFTQAGVKNVLKNNISYQNPRDYVYASNIQLNNTWNGGVYVTYEDFITTDTTGISGTRNADGDLPYLDFLRLAPASDLIDAGVDAGLPFRGTSPEIGAFETSVGELHLNTLPVISISSPIKGDSFESPATITIDVNASDPDGTITRIELFNGANKLGEITTPPYSFVLKDLPAGFYSLKAVATDNLKSATTSSTLELLVTSYNDDREYFNLYPNPNNGCFSVYFTTQIKAENFTICVLNLTGKTVYQANFQQVSDAMQFDLSYIDPGAYILMIKSNLIVVTQKFIKG